MVFKVCIIIAIVLFALIGLAVTRLRFRIAYVDEFVASLQVWFIKIRFFPHKAPKPPKPQKFEIKRFRKRLKKRMRKADKIEEKKLKKQAKANDTEKTEKSEQKSKPRDIKGLLDMLIDVLKILLDKFPRYLKTKVDRLVIGVASDDAATTALTYGAVVQSVQYIITLLENKAGLYAGKKSCVSVYPDFTCDKWNAEIDITLSIRIWQVISIGISLLLWYVKRRVGKKSESSSNNDVDNNLNSNTENA